MAVNPPISEQGVPFRLQDEYVLLERRGAEIEIKIPNKSSLTAKGKIFLTTARLVFVSKNFTTDKFKSFDMPIISLSRIEFKQPVFGSNYLQFQCRPINATLPQVAAVKIWFTEGGCDKFLRSFEHVSKQVNEQRRNRTMNQNLYNNWREGFFNSNKAFYDPSDPTVVLTEQPPVFNPGQKYFGENIYVNPINNYPSLSPTPPSPTHTQPTPPSMPTANNYPTLETRETTGTQIGSNKNDYHPNINPSQQTPNYPPQSNAHYPLQPNTHYPPQPNAPYPPQPNAHYPHQPNMATSSPPVSNQNIPNQQPTNYPTPPPPLPGENVPGQPNANYPQYNQNVPQMYNPYPAMNNQQNAGYYFGFWGPHLTQGNQ
jgi:hypothetical protein